VSKLDFDGIWNAYQKAAAAAGWTPDGMNESGNSPETRMILSNWRNGPATTDLRIYGTKDGGVTVSVTVTTDK